MATIEFLFLANHAEVRDGLLFALGAGWSEYHRPLSPDGQAPVSHFGIAASILVPWEETNQPHPLTIWIERQEDESVLSHLETDVLMGRPPHLAAGSDQREILGLGIDLVFPEQGIYRLKANVDEDVRSVSFFVIDYPSSY